MSHGVLTSEVPTVGLLQPSFVLMLHLASQPTLQTSCVFDYRPRASSDVRVYSSCTSFCRVAPFRARLETQETKNSTRVHTRVSSFLHQALPNKYPYLGRFRASCELQNATYLTIHLKNNLYMLPSVPTPDIPFRWYGQAYLFLDFARCLTPDASQLSKTRYLPPIPARFSAHIKYRRHMVSIPDQDHIMSA